LDMLSLHRELKLIMLRSKLVTEPPQKGVHLRDQHE
jgi:hypothetical protein